MKLTREHRIMHGLLVLCIVAAFFCFAFAILPDQLAKAGIVAETPAPSKFLKISDIVSRTKPSPAEEKTSTKSRIVARFVPERKPGDPFAEPRTEEHELDDADSFDSTAGAGVAIDDDSYEAHHYMGEEFGGEDLHAEAAIGSDESDLAIGDPYGDMTSGVVERAYLNREPKPQVVKHRISSLARGDPATIDSQRGRRKKPWLLTPAGFEKDVAFWRDIYAKYDKNYVVIHHPRYLGIIYDVVNLTDIENDPRLTRIERDHTKEKRISAHRERIEDALMVLATNPLSSSLTHEQWRVKQLFAGVTERNKYARAYRKDGVRAQLGQRDKFITGLAYSGRYLGEIEMIFDNYGMPKELTRLIFVESMFNTKARSSAGASGIWQFMPRTGRLFLGISKIADERNDPIKATHAAAKLLRQNYHELGTWPLAINAYNAGRGRLKQAVKQVGSRDIGRIIRNFKHRSYGFASRNFYLEFLAAYEVAEHAERYFGTIQHDEPLSYEVVRSNYHLSLPDVARLAGISMEELTELNPAFSHHVTSGRKLIPRRFGVRVPDNRGDLFMAAAARAPKSKTGKFYHVVVRGETLGSIARAYGVTPMALRKNNRSVGRRLHRGQKLIIPAVGGN